MCIRDSSNAAAISGKIALIDRGVCSFIQKFNNAATAGAAAVVIVDDEDEPLPFAMGGGDPGSVPIPGVMIRLVDGGKVKPALAQGSLTAGAAPTAPRHRARAPPRGRLCQPLLHPDPSHLHPGERRLPIEAHADVGVVAQ